MPKLKESTRKLEAEVARLNQELQRFPPDFTLNLRLTTATAGTRAETKEAYNGINDFSDYAPVRVGIFKLFKIPLTKWSVPTAILGGVVLLLLMLLFMDITIRTPSSPRKITSPPRRRPIYADGSSRFTPTRADQLIKKGEVLFKIDPEPFQAAVDMRKAELAAADQGLASLSRRLERGQVFFGRSPCALETKRSRIRALPRLSGTGGGERTGC